MIKNLLTHLADGGTLVVPHRLVGARVGLAYARAQRAAGRRCFASADILTVDAWLRRGWEVQAERLTTRLISRAQSQCLWEQIVAAVGTPGGLLATAPAARWAAAAWRDLQHFDIDPDSLLGPADTRTFLGWAREYQARLQQNGWVDLDQALLSAASAWSVSPEIPPLLWLPGVAPTPAAARLPRALAQRGWPVQIAPGPAHAARVASTVLADESAELAAALDWARQQIKHGSAGIAVVIADLAGRRAEVRAAIAQGLEDAPAAPAFRFGDGEPAIELPALGAAFTALAVGAGSTDFGTLSRFLRSPFFGCCTRDEAAGAALETRLRRAPAHHWNLFEALQDHGFRDRLAQHYPHLKACLMRAAAVPGDPAARRSVSEWTRNLAPLSGGTGLANRVARRCPCPGHPTLAGSAGGGGRPGPDAAGAYTACRAAASDPGRGPAAAAGAPGRQRHRDSRQPE